MSRRFRRPARYYLHKSQRKLDKPIEQRITELFEEMDEEFEPGTLAAPEKVPLSEPISIEWTKRGPPAGHRNSIECPQCDKPAWMASEECWNCGFGVLAWLEDLEAEKQAQLQARREALDRQERREWQRVVGFITMLGVLCLFVAPLTSGPLTSALLFTGGIALAAAWVINKLFC